MCKFLITISIVYNTFTYCNAFKKFLVCEYAQKYMALCGATPTIFGPRPLNSARDPSVSTIYLKWMNGRKKISLSLSLHKKIKWWNRLTLNNSIC